MKLFLPIVFMFYSNQLFAVKCLKENIKEFYKKYFEYIVKGKVINVSHKLNELENGMLKKVVLPTSSLNLLRLSSR